MQHVKETQDRPRHLPKLQPLPFAICAHSHPQASFLSIGLGVNASPQEGDDFFRWCCGLQRRVTKDSVVMGRDGGMKHPGNEGKKGFYN